MIDMSFHFAGNYTTVLGKNATVYGNYWIYGKQHEVAGGHNFNHGYVTFNIKDEEGKRNAVPLVLTLKIIEPEWAIGYYDENGSWHRNEGEPSDTILFLVKQDYERHFSNIK